MRKEDYLRRLRDLLACLPAEQLEESVSFLEEAIDDRIESGMSEEDAVAAMGSPGSVAEAILDDLPVVPRAIAKTKRKSNVLLWVLVVLGSPLWVVLALAFAAVFVVVYLCIWILALCVWIVAAALVGAGLTLLVIAISGLLVGLVPFAVAMSGVALGFLGVGLLTGAAAWAVSRQIARLSALWVRKALSPFRKDGGSRGGGAGERDSGRPRSPLASDAAAFVA